MKGRLRWRKRLCGMLRSNVVVVGSYEWFSGDHFIFSRLIYAYDRGKLIILSSNSTCAVKLDAISTSFTVHLTWSTLWVVEKISMTSQ
jgi:hypothetical protein